jgi:DNA-binding beta-propeller fold protein YncE
MWCRMSGMMVHVLGTGAGRIAIMATAPVVLAGVLLCVSCAKDGRASTHEYEAKIMSCPGATGEMVPFLFLRPDNTKLYVGYRRDADGMPSGIVSAVLVDSDTVGPQFNSNGMCLESFMLEGQGSEQWLADTYWKWERGRTGGVAYAIKIDDPSGENIPFNNLYVVDLSTHEVLHTIELPQLADFVTSLDRSKIYAWNQDPVPDPEGQCVSVIDTHSYTITKKIHFLGGAPYASGMTPTGDRLFLYNGKLFAIDTRTDEIMPEWLGVTKGSLSRYSTCALNLAVTSSRMYLGSCARDDQEAEHWAINDYNVSGSFMRTIPVSSDIQYVVPVPKKNKLYYAGKGGVYVIDLKGVPSQ